MKAQQTREQIADELAHKAESLCHNDGWFDKGEMRSLILSALASVRAEGEQIDCPACGGTVKLVSSATLSLALWQHWNWVCPKRAEGEPPSLIKGQRSYVTRDGAKVTEFEIDHEALAKIDPFDAMRTPFPTLKGAEGEPERQLIAKMRGRGYDPEVIANAYGFTINEDNTLHGLTAGDMGYEPSGLPLDHWTCEWIKKLEVAEQERDALRKERDELGERAERYAMEAESLTRRLMQAESQLATLTAEGRAEGSDPLNQVLTILRDEDCPEDVRIVMARDVADEAIQARFRAQAKVKDEGRVEGLREAADALEEDPGRPIRSRFDAADWLRSLAQTQPREFTQDPDRLEMGPEWNKPREEGR